MAFVIQNIYHICVFYCILINVVIFAHYLPTSAPSSRTNSVISFPGGMRTYNSSGTRMHPSLQQQRSFMANLTHCAEDDQTFCTKNDNYPLEHIQRLLQQHSHRYADMFTNDVVANDISIRSDEFDIEHLCETEEKVIYPTSGRTPDGSELYIFNTENHKQGVRVSMCRKYNESKRSNKSMEPQACKMAEIFPSSYKAECKQQMVYRQLVSLDANGQSTKNHFEFPACCSCVLYRTDKS